MRDAISRLLAPRSVAIIGASATQGSLGGGVVANLDRFGFAGDIHLINPNRSEINGRPCLASAEALPMGVDCAVLAIPRAGILSAVEACGRRGVGGVIVFSAGFAEAGPDGVAAQHELARLAGQYGMAVEGPNCLGMVNYVDGVPLTFGNAQPAPLAGRPGVGMVSQSGAMATVLRAALTARDVGISFAISTGNEAVSGVEDFLAYLLADDATHVVAMVVEQFRSPPRFLELAAQARQAGKVIVLLHPGQSEAARQSAETHTGKLAGDHAVMRTLVSHAGVLVAETLEELIDLAELLVRCPALPHAGAAVMTDSGAFKALTLDYCAQIGLELPALSAETQAALDAVMPEFTVSTNPLDLTAQALVDRDLYRKAMIPLLEDERFGSLVLAVILSNAPTARIKLPPVLEALRDLKPTKPVIFAMLGEEAEVPPELVAECRALGVPFFRSPERVMRVLARLTEFAARPSWPANPAFCPADLVLPANPASGLVVAEYQSKQMLAALGIPIPAGELARDRAGAQAIAERIGYPVALKAQSAALSHKSDAGGVVLRLNDATELAQGWDRLHDNLRRASPGLVLDGVLVERMAAPGLELILGARRDPDWGPVLLVGLGGVMAEAIADVRLLPPDLPAAAIEAELGRLKAAALLRGFRGAPAVDVAAAAAVLAKLGALVRARPEIREIEINPLFVYPAGAGVLAVDALMVTG
jgi:acyl-CoA synthetase (NDP forming)